MCLQRDADVKIWGWDKPGRKIRVVPSWDKRSVNTKTGKDGKWQVSVSTPGAGGSYDIVVNGSDKITIKNIIMGDVWVCGGQSNMDRKLGFQPGQKPIVNFYEESQKANKPDIRLFIVDRVSTTEPQNDCTGAWVVCTPETVLEFSAIGYFFGKKINEVTNIPMGMIESDWGGTPVEAWTRKSAMNNSFWLKREEDRFERFAADSAAYARAMESFEKGFGPKPDLPWSMGYKNRTAHHIGGLYNGMIHPLLNFYIKGAIWYQGESNRSEPDQYAKQFPNMIQNWRDDWAVGDFPFYFVQIAPYYYNNEFNIPPIWEAQYEALKMKNVEMASTQDIGQIYDIHPPEKEEVGRRLALAALNKTYGKSDVVYSGPVLKSTTFRNGKVILEFDPMGGTLFSAGAGIGGIPSFYVAGERRIFHPASVAQDGNTITVSTDMIDDPKALRYLWNDKANATIYNSYGLPAAGFRTDRWDDAKYEE